MRVRKRRRSEVSRREAGGGGKLKGEWWAMGRGCLHPQDTADTDPKLRLHPDTIQIGIQAGYS